MARPAAKITRPTLKGVAARPRLFARLDQIRRRHRIAWVSAPAGSGKTTLAASWLAARERPCLWYQFDPGDADPATFFYYLREAVRRLAPRRRETLPLLTPEYALGLDVYARNFFEAMGARLPRGTALVFDNFQEFPEDAPLQAILPQALAALPDGVRVLVLSRGAPPPTFARLIAEGAVGFFEPDELNLSAAETRALARKRVGKPVEAAAAEAVRAQTGGWMAGTVLLLEARHRVLPPPREAGSPAHQVLFDYFAAEIFDRAPADAQRLLLATALLPEVSVPAAVALAEEPRAGEILSELVARNFFTLRLAGQEPRYRYHPLFREFLLSRAQRTLEAGERRALAGRAAEILTAAGAPEPAAALLVEAGAFEQLASLIVANAPTLAHQGRLALIQGWLRALPAEMMERAPWLSYWEGAAHMLSDSLSARAAFERAYALFTKERDAAGRLLSWAGVVETFVYQWSDFTLLDRWIGELETLRREIPAFPSPAIEAHVVGGIVCALMFRQPHHPDLPKWAETAKEISLGAGDLSTRATLSIHLIFYYAWLLGDEAKASLFVEQLEDTLRSSKATPFFNLSFHAVEAARLWIMGENERCLSVVEDALRLSRENGIHAFDYMLAVHGSAAALSEGRLDTAADYLRAMSPIVETHRLTDIGHYHYHKGWESLCHGDYGAALDHFQATAAIARRVGMPLGIAATLYSVADALIELDRTDEARIALNESRAIGDAIRSNTADHVCSWLEARLAFRRGDREAALASLRRHLAISREKGILNHKNWRSDVMAGLYAEALEAGIETEQARHIIAKRKLAPPDGCDLESWPWPLRIRMLGGFELFRDGEPVRFSVKAPRKPLELLHALIALGGENVRESALADLLWPDADGDAAAHALETTVHRLRKLLGSPSAIVRQEGRMSLDGRLCWVDALALSRQLRRGLELVQGEQPGLGEVRRQAERIVALYRGPLVPAGRAEHDAAEPLRARLREQLSRFLAEAERHLARAGEGGLAESYLARAHEADSAIEAARSAGGAEEDGPVLRLVSGSGTAARPRRG